MGAKVVIIPAYQPDFQLTELVEKLNKQEIPVLVVDDGSGEEYTALFESISHKATVIHNQSNMGKGAALKKGITALDTLFPDCDGFITADADGQHKVEDILRVKKELENGSEIVLTVRRLAGEIPFRSKFGNDLSRVVYTVMNGHYFDDNQSGLRGFAKKHSEWMKTVKGNKYDWEMNVLVFADKQALKIAVLPIEAIYINDNKSSHFNPVGDTLRIYKRMFLSVWPSILGVLLWFILTALSSILLGYDYFYLTVPSAVMISALINVLLQKIIVFRKVIFKDGLRTLLFSIIRATVYTIFIGIISLVFEIVPMLLTVTAVAAVMLITEYFLHKKMHGFYRKNVK